MFAYKRTWVCILTLVIIAVSFAISRVVTSVFDGRYWYLIGGIMLAELQLGLITMELMKTDDRGMPVFLGNLIVAAGYFIFALCMIFISCSEVTLFVTHSIALVVILLLHIFLCLAHNATLNHSAAQQTALQSKKDYLLKMEKFKMLRKNWLAEDPALAKKISMLMDDARFTPESVPGSAEIDMQVMQKIEALNDAETPAAAAICADDLKAAFAYRKMAIKDLR